MDDNGEWYLKRGAGANGNGILYYKPTSGVQPASGQIVASRFSSVFHLKGDVTQGTHVEYITISGFQFRHSSYTLGHIEPRANTDGTLLLENARNNNILNNDFKHIGGYAIWLYLDSTDNIIDNNSSQDTGAGFVLMTGSKLSYQEPHLIIDYRQNADKVYPLRNQVTDNTASGTGQIRSYNAGVHMETRYNWTMSISDIPKI